ncbi:helix-turn-helix domain-containing protein [Roseibium litorale]|uniref:Helix-turn-helix domain-containing protein n=1 Tax=Roseibium litorale TaxID=2803841 RepID=A0ABR9CQV1_9HYPH|nr:helix-turn-helix domain-containing protein [Roseibium litorale]MBD8892780.1 helix-turn-helix domain-containing protein [Roseibium litorale]
MTGSTPIPRYHLYGDGGDVEDFDFFHIETIRARSKPLGWSLEPHSHAHLHQVLMITKGMGRLIDDAGEREVPPGTAVFNPAGSVHGWTFTPDTEGHVLSFTGDYLGGDDSKRSLAERRAMQAGATSLFAAGPEDRRRLDFYLAEMATEFDGGERRRDVFRPLLALVLMVLFSQSGDGGKTDRTPGFSLFKFRALVEEHFRSERSPEFYAGEMGLTVARLNRYCRLFTDRTAAQSIRDRVVIEAKRLLAFSGLGISQIAYDLGYEDPAYFSRLFRKETGESPADFRARQG